SSGGVINEHCVWLVQVLTLEVGQCLKRMLCNVSRSSVFVIGSLPDRCLRIWCQLLGILA
ncbi:hypothetical protein L9F63_024760, partial [Diploptera punctata]